MGKQTAQAKEVYYLEKETLFPSQYGYSTNLASIELMTNISQAIHNNEYT